MVVYMRSDDVGFVCLNIDAHTLLFKAHILYRG